VLQFELENAALRETNKQQEAQILELQKQVQGEKCYSLFRACSAACYMNKHQVNAQMCVCVCVYLAAFEQKCGGGLGVLCRPGEAQRLSSLTFGCFQVRGKNPQVLTGPAPSQRTLCMQGETDARDATGKSPLVTARDYLWAVWASWAQEGTLL